MSGTTIVITGANGFIGLNLAAHLSYISGLSVISLTRGCTESEMISQLQSADFVFHLAGVNRPEHAAQFLVDNLNFTKFVISTLESGHKAYTLIFASTIQVDLQNDYGRSKLESENVIKEHVRRGRAIIYRLPGVFGKWCRANYNSVVATFCNNIAHDLPLEIRDPAFVLPLLYIDDLVEQWMLKLKEANYESGWSYEAVSGIQTITLGGLAELIYSFKKIRSSLILPDFSYSLTKSLYSTYLSYLPVDKFGYQLELKSDSRGSLVEIIKSRSAGQIFVSTTMPSVTRGNHFHHLKTEKFIVISGNGLIRFRRIDSDEVIEYKVSGDTPMVVDIPPGYTHSITNIGDQEMVTMFWANEMFDAQRPDTYSLGV